MRIVSMLLLVVAAAFGCKDFQGADPIQTESSLKSAAPCTMAWAEILDEYKKNSVRFEKETFPTKLKGTKVEWSGEVESISGKFAKIDIDGSTGADVKLFMAEPEILKLNEKEKVRFEGVITDWTRISLDGFILEVDGRLKP